MPTLFRVCRMSTLSGGLILWFQSQKRVQGNGARHKVLSVMAVREPYVFVGTAPDASYWLLRCEDELTESPAEEDYWAEAAEFADSVGVDIISSSLGFHDFDDSSYNYKYSQLDGHTSFISATASMLASKGMILVNSAGNDGMSSWKK